MFSAGDGERLPYSEKLRRVHLREHQLDDVHGLSARIPGVTATLCQHQHVTQLARLPVARPARKPRFVSPQFILFTVDNYSIVIELGPIGSRPIKYLSLIHI